MADSRNDELACKILPVKNHLVILDRDGVVNEDRDDYVKSADEWIPIPGSLDAITRLSQAGFKIAIATNQSGLGRGIFSETALNEMHQKMERLLNDKGENIHAIAFCPHSPEDNCNCRKPRTGLVKSIETTLQHNALNAYFVGDKSSDIQAAINSGCLPVLVRTGKGKKTEAELKDSESCNLPIYANLAEFVDAILKPDQKFD